MARFLHSHFEAPPPTHRPCGKPPEEDPLRAALPPISDAWLSFPYTDYELSRKP